MKVEQPCPACARVFEAREWFDGRCPTCNAAYGWADAPGLHTVHKHPARMVAWAERSRGSVGGLGLANRQTPPPSPAGDDYLGTLIDMKLAGDVLTVRMRLTDDEQAVARARISQLTPAPEPLPASTLDQLLGELSTFRQPTPSTKETMNEGQEGEVDERGPGGRTGAPD